MAEVAALRAFTRFYTRRVGVLGDGLLGTGHPLPDARVLFELGQADAVEVATLRDELAIDPGFLSRVLTRLERSGLVAREPSPLDRRRQRARLTEAGRAAFADLDARSAAHHAALLDGVDSAELVRALATVQQALEPGGDVVLRAPGPGDLGWIVARHGARYAAELGWDERFEALVARVVADFAASGGERSRAWIAEVGGAPAGCVMCVPEDERTARLRLLLVEPWARGSGVGGRLVDACLDFARDAGFERMVLWTQDVLRDAARLYERRGFTITEEEPHAMFGPPMTGRTLSAPLTR